MRYDVAIVGAGFAGSILARALNQRGLTVALFDRQRHPRFALGESTTPLANFALERLAARYRLPDLHQLATHGRWLRHHPELRRGLKRGFSFFWHRPGQPYENDSDNPNRLLVAASPDDARADTHWLRSDVDHHLLRQAEHEGVTVHTGAAVTRLEVAPHQVALHAEIEGRDRRITARVLVDGSGPRGVLARAVEAEERPAAEVLGGLTTTLVFGHLEGGEPFADVARHQGADLADGPYPDDRAAVHHLLAEGWIYALPFDHGVTSVGAILRHDLAPDLVRRAAEDPAGAWHALLARYPTLETQWRTAVPCQPFAARVRLPYQLDPPAVPSAFWLPHGQAFFDPLFSTGIAWSLLAVERLAMVITGEHGDAESHRLLCRQEAGQIEALVESAHRVLGDPQLFGAVARLYFATVSHAEARQRLAPMEPGSSVGAWEGFLGAGDGRLRGLFRHTADTLRDMMVGTPKVDRRGFLADLAARIRPFDVAGLDDPRHRNLIPVDLEILVERAHLLGLSRSEVLRALPRLLGDVPPESVAD